MTKAKENAESKLRFLFGKGTINILVFLHERREARHSEISERRFVSSRETLSRRLKELENLRLIMREVKTTRPPRTVYRLSELGSHVTTMLLGVMSTISRSKDRREKNE